VRAAVHAARSGAPHGLRIECEVRTLAELGEALDAEADAVLLDNMTDDEIGRAVELVGGRALVEVSGGVTLERVALLATLGVDVVSVGTLTHSAPSVDISMVFEPARG
jgi:nicotinate-nucleotide pyrophosphorylase (carboxylating)